MNLVKLAFFLLPMYVFCQESGIKFFEGSWNDVCEKAKQENKIIFVDAYAVWCGPCKWMAKNVFSNDTVARFYNKNFINYKIDVDKGEGKILAARYGAAAMPTYLFLNYKGEMIHRGLGAKQVVDFIKLGEKALNPIGCFAYWQNRYIKGERHSSFMYRYLQESKEIGFDTKSIIEEYIKNVNHDSLYTYNNFFIIKEYIQSINDSMFNFVLKNREKYYKIVGKKEVDEIFYREYQQAYNIAIRTFNKALYDSVTVSLKKSGLVFADTLIAKINMYYYKITGNINGYYNSAVEYLDNYGGDRDWKLLNDVAFDMCVSGFIDSIRLKHTEKWIRKSIELNDNYYNNYTYTLLLFKIKDYDNGVKYANKAIMIAKEENIDYSVVEDLLGKMTSNKVNEK